jgi:hypothetical protein
VEEPGPEPHFVAHETCLSGSSAARRAAAPVSLGAGDEFSARRASILVMKLGGEAGDDDDGNDGRG